MARAPTREISAPAEIRGVSTPVNTYVRPPDPAPSPLHDLAEGLAKLDAGLGAFLEKRKVAGQDAEKQRAIHDAYLANGEGFDEGTKRGMIPFGESPTYMEWYRKTQGDVQGRKLFDRFVVDYQNWEGRTSGDPAAFQGFMQDFLTKNAGEIQDPNVLAGFNPHIERVFEEGYRNFTNDRSDALKKDGVSLSGSRITDTIERAEEDARAGGADVDQDTLWESIVLERMDATKRIAESDYDPMMVDAIILQAEESGNEDLLDLLDRKLPGAEFPLSHDPAVREKKLKAIDRIDAARASAATTRAAAEEKADKIRHNGIVADVYRQLSVDPNYIIPEETLNEIGRRDPDFRGKLKSIRESMVANGKVEDPDAVALIMADIHEGADDSYVLEKYRQGIIRDPDTLTKALDRVKAVQNATKAGGVFDSASYKDTIKRITNATGQGEMSFLDGVRGMTEDGARAAYDYRTALLEWEAANPKASLIEREKAAFDIGKSILGRIQPDPTKQQEGLYPEQQQPQAAQPEATQPTAQPEATQPEAAPEAAPEAPAVEQPETQGAVPPTESPKMTAAIRQLAKKHGVPEQVARELLLQEDVPVDPPAGEAAPAAPPGLEASEQDMGTTIMENLSRPGPLSNFSQWFFGEEEPGVDGTTTNAIPEADRNRLMDILRNAPARTDGTQGSIPSEAIFDLLGNTEGTDKGDGYNETLGYGAFTGGDVDLVNMTLDEVDELQTKMLQHPGNTWDSSAAGRFQIVRTTLRGLRQELGLKGTEKFDAKMQNRLAAALLERRGLSKWQAGEITDEQFLDNLSLEWASLPNSQGNGSYKGQRAATTPAKVLAAFRNGPPGHTSATLKAQAAVPEGTPAAYAKIPDQDGNGDGGQIAKFMAWNSDPVANHEANLKSINPTLADVVRRAQTLTKTKLVVGSGKRDETLQAKAVEWGWSKTHDSDHLHGGAVDLWPLDEDGAVNFDQTLQGEIVKAMKQAAQELGVDLDVGAEWKKFKDRPHFAIKGSTST